MEEEHPSFRIVLQDLYVIGNDDCMVL